MKYALTACAAALAAFLLALFAFRTRPAANNLSAKGGLAEQYPVQTAQFHRPAAEDARWHERRGHAFSLQDRDEAYPDDPRLVRILAGRPKERPLPDTCFTCHATAAATGGARKPLDCADCHEARTTALRLTRTAPRPARNRQELRTLVCAQCHHDYAGAGWTHAETGAQVVRVRHPQFEMYSRGIHSRAGTDCSDCHMPYERRGKTHITDHNARSPLTNLGRACGRCHRVNEGELRARVEEIQHRTAALVSRAEDALVAALDAIHDAQAGGAAPETALRLQTEAQRRLLFVIADRSQGFHAPQESARILAEAIDYARQAQIEAVRRQK